MHEKKRRNSISIIEEQKSVFAIGDIHGRYDLLIEAEKQIIREPDTTKLIVILGDFVDRGPQSAQILDHFCAKSSAGVRRICLLGNHEAMMLAFIKQPKKYSRWLDFGGKATLLSYSIPFQEIVTAPTNWNRFQTILESHIPAEHVQFLESLPIQACFGNVKFAHAGLKREDRLLGQLNDDSFDLRVEALHSWAQDDECLIVHGHFAQKSPSFTNNCLNLDTGAYASGQLTYANIRPDGNYELFSISL